MAENYVSYSRSCYVPKISKCKLHVRKLFQLCLGLLDKLLQIGKIVLWKTTFAIADTPQHTQHNKAKEIK